MVKFPTWQRIVNNVLKQSILDYVYVQDPTIVLNVTSLKPLIGDHKLVTVTINQKVEKVSPIIKRNWGFYTQKKTSECAHLCKF